jgi:hypothetical protein
MYAYRINRIFFYQLKIFFSHNKLANSTYPFPDVNMTCADLCGNNKLLSSTVRVQVR